MLMSELSIPSNYARWIVCFMIACSLSLQIHQNDIDNFDLLYLLSLMSNSLICSHSSR